MKNFLSRFLVSFGILLLLCAGIGAGTIYADLNPVTECYNEAGQLVPCGDTTAVGNSKCVEGEKCGGPRSVHGDRCRREGGTVKGSCKSCTDLGQRASLCVDAERSVCDTYSSGAGSNSVLCGQTESSECVEDRNSVTGAKCIPKATPPGETLPSTCWVRTCKLATSSNPSPE